MSVAASAPVNVEWNRSLFAASSNVWPSPSGGAMLPSVPVELEWNHCIKFSNLLTTYCKVWPFPLMISFG